MPAMTSQGYYSPSVNHLDPCRSQKLPVEKCYSVEADVFIGDPDTPSPIVLDSPGSPTSLSVPKQAGSRSSSFATKSEISDYESSSNLSKDESKKNQKFHFPSFRTDRSRTGNDIYSTEQSSPSVSSPGHKRHNSFLQKKLHRLNQSIRTSVAEWKRKQTRYESAHGRTQDESRYKSADMLAEEDEENSSSPQTSRMNLKSSSFDNILSSFNSKYFTIPRKSKQMDINDALVLKLVREHQKTKEEAERLVKLQRLESIDCDTAVLTFSVYKLTPSGRRESNKQVLQIDPDQECLILFGRGCVEVEIYLSDIQAVERTSLANSHDHDCCFCIESTNCTLLLEAEKSETREEIICRIRSCLSQKFGGDEESFCGILEKKSNTLNIWSKKEVRIEGSKLMYRSLVSQKSHYKKAIDISTGKAVINSNHVNCQIRINDGFNSFVFREPNMSSVAFKNWVNKLYTAQNLPLPDMSRRSRDRELPPEGLFERIFEEIHAVKMDSKGTNYHLSRMEDFLKQLQHNLTERRISSASSKSGSVVLVGNHMPNYGSYESSLAGSSAKESSFENSPLVHSDNNSVNKSSIADSSLVSSSGNEKQDSTKSDQDKDTNRHSNIYLELESMTYCNNDDSSSASEVFLKPPEGSSINTTNTLTDRGSLQTSPQPLLAYEISEANGSSSSLAGDFQNALDEEPELEMEKTLTSNDVNGNLKEEQRKSEVRSVNDESNEASSRPESVYDNCSNTEPSDEDNKSQPWSEYENTSETDNDVVGSTKQAINQSKEADELASRVAVFDPEIDELKSKYHEIIEETYCNVESGCLESTPGLLVDETQSKSSDDRESRLTTPVNSSTSEHNSSFNFHSEPQVAAVTETNPDLKISLPSSVSSSKPKTPTSSGCLPDISPSFPAPPSPIAVVSPPQAVPTPPPVAISASVPPPPPPPPCGAPPPSSGRAPPPPPVNGVPPPPPLMNQKSLRNSMLRSKKYKTVHWKPVTCRDKLESSIWKTAPVDVNIAEDQLRKLESLFKIENSTNKLTKPSKVFGSKPTYNMDQNRARNLELFVKRKEFDLDENLLNAYFALDDVERQIHFLQQIRDFQPSDADLKHFCALSEEQLKELPSVQRNMAIICKIPNLNLKLDILHSVTEIREQSNQVESNIRAALKLCQQLQTNEKLHLLLQYCLYVGNQLNDCANKRQKIEAFSVVDSLPRFMEVRSSSSADYSLLNYVVELVHNQNPHLLTVADEIDVRMVEFLLGDSSGAKPSNKSGKRDGFHMLKAPVDLLSKSSAKAQESVVKIKEMQFAANELEGFSAGSAEKVFVEQVEKLLQLDCVYQIINCKELLSELEKSYSSLLVQLAEDKSTDPAQLFGIFNLFLSNVAQIKSQLKSESPKIHAKKAAHSSAFVNELTAATRKLK